MAKLNKTQREYLLKELKQLLNKALNAFDKARGKKQVRTLADLSERRGDGTVTIREAINMIKNGTLVPVARSYNEDGDEIDLDQPYEGGYNSDLDHLLVMKSDVKNIAYNNETKRMRDELDRQGEEQISAIERELIFADSNDALATIDRFQRSLNELVRNLK